MTVSQFVHLCHKPSGTEDLFALPALILDGSILSNQLIYSPMPFLY